MSAASRNGQILVTIRRVTAPFSLVGSCSLIYLILARRIRKRHRNALTNNDRNNTMGTYHRFVLGISLTDIGFSIAFMFGVTPLPRELAPGAMGNLTSCGARAFSIQWFGTLGPFYNVCLELYYVAIICAGMKPRDFERRFEGWCHAVIHVISLGLGIAGLVGEAYNPSVGTVTGCYINHYPQGCLNNDEVDCERGENARVYFFFLGLLPYYIVLFMLYGSLVAILWTVLRKDCATRQFQNQAQEGSLLRSTEPMTKRQVVLDKDQEGKEQEEQDHQDQQEQHKPEEEEGGSKLFSRRRKRRRRSSNILQRLSVAAPRPVLAITRTVTIQSLLYGVFFSLTYFAFTIFRTIIYFEELSRQNFNLFPLSIVNSIFLPLQGLFNFLVFVRPKFQRLRRERPPDKSLTWVICRTISSKTATEILAEEAAARQERRYHESTSTTKVQNNVENLAPNEHSDNNNDNDSNDDLEAKEEDIEEDDDSNSSGPLGKSPMVRWRKALSQSVSSSTSSRFVRRTIVYKSDDEDERDDFDDDDGSVASFGRNNTGTNAVDASDHDNDDEIPPPPPPPTTPFSLSSRGWFRKEAK